MALVTYTIEQLPPSSNPTGDELIEVTQDGLSRKMLLSKVFSAGDSAYQVAVKDGFPGTEQQWLASLVGPQGLSAYQVAVSEGYQGTPAQWLLSLKGADGKSSYDLAVERGFSGTVEQYLQSLIGADGKSAYQIAQEDGFVGTQAQWLESLKGGPGTDGRNGDGLKVLGSVQSVNDLPSDAVTGDAWIVGDQLYIKLQNGSWYQSEVIINEAQFELLLSQTQTARDQAVSANTQAQAALANFNQFQAQVQTNTTDIASLKTRVSNLEYVAPSITNFRINAVSSYVIERGSSASNIMLTWALAGSAPTSQSISNGVGNIPVGTLSHLLVSSYSTAQTWTLTVGNTRPDGQTVSASASVTLVIRQKAYWGVSNKTTLNNADILAFSSDFATGVARSVTYNATGGAYPYYVYPASFGNPTSVKVGGFDFSDYVIVEQAVTNASGYTDTYKVIRFNTIQTGAAISVAWG